MRRQRTAIFGTHHPAREPTLILTSWSLPDSAPHTSPGRPASCRTLAFGRLDENFQYLSINGSKRSRALLPGRRARPCPGRRPRPWHTIHFVRPAFKIYTGIARIADPAIRRYLDGVFPASSPSDREQCRDLAVFGGSSFMCANTPATGCARDRVKPRETCLLAALPRQESLTVSATVLGSMSPPKVA